MALCFKAAGEPGRELNWRDLKFKETITRIVVQVFNGFGREEGVLLKSGTGQVLFFALATGTFPTS